MAGSQQWRSVSAPNLTRSTSNGRVHWAVVTQPEPQDELHPYTNRDADGDGDVDLKDAAILAEYETGEREPDAETAWKRALARIGRIAAGFGLMIAGVVMIFVPGPGLLAFAAGLAILSKDFVWAQKVLRFVRKVVPGLDPDEPIPKKALYMSAVFLVLGILGSIYWFGFGGEETIRGWVGIQSAGLSNFFSICVNVLYVVGRL